jgi:Protein kinase domain/WD40-like Beta Propeller Repeat
VTAPPPHLAEALRDRYLIERELGRGGMATLYLARDLRHKRPVALKVLHAELPDALGTARFQREIELAARLQHPHILTVLDSGETAGELWFTMPFVEGETLRARLMRERRLPLEDALRITGDAARALDYAHRHGVIHRDVKPENLLLAEDGTTLVSDFGIARALETEGGQKLTATGQAVGTPAYMSPEQTSGDRTLDARTDIYSLACVLYEMLVGEPPLAGPTVKGILARRFSEPPPSVRRSRASVPAVVDAAIQRALAPAPPHRFASAAEFAHALALSGLSPVAGPPGAAARRRVLRIVALSLGVGVLVGLGVLFAWRRGADGRVEGAPAASTPARGPLRVAVLPFANLGDSADAYFADGITAEIRGKLAALPALRVIASTSDGSGEDFFIPPEVYGSEYPDWSPDSAHVAFDNVGLVCIYTRGGVEERCLARGYYPSWSPDGARLAFSVGPFENPLDQFHIHTIAIDGSDEQDLSPPLALRSVELFPTWSPDGSKLLFRFVDYSGESAVERAYGMDPDGQSRLELAPSLEVQSAAWSRDGSRVALVVETPVFELLHLYTVNSDGTDLTRLGAAGNITSIAWRP